MMNRPRSRPPKTARKLLSFLRRYEEEYDLGTELEAEFRFHAREKGAVRAIFWYWGQVIFAVPIYLRRCFHSGGTLMLNNFKITLRHMRRRKSFSLINITGLAVGMACCFVVLLFVQEELSYDRFHQNADKIFRISQSIHRPAGDYYSIRIPSWVGPRLVESLPEVENSVRLVRWSGVVNSGDKRFNERLFFADPSFFEVFTFLLGEGDSERALSNPNNVVISRKLAEKYFGDRHPLGSTLTVDGRHDFIVSGVMKDSPKNSHIKIDFLAPFEHTRHLFGEERYKGDRIPAYTYLMLNQPESSLPVGNKLPGFVVGQKGEEYAAGRAFSLQAMTDIHLNSHTSIELEANSRIQYTYYLIAVALIILLLACVNYINLSTARAAQRAQEVGVRKVMGADRRRLIQQFIGESLTYSILALLMAVALIYILLPLFNSIMDRDLTMNVSAHPNLSLGFIGLSLLVGLAAGCYPAFLLSSFRAAVIVKGKIGRNQFTGSLVRKGLVVFQFSLALVFIIGMLAVNRQIDFIQNRDLGFDKEQVLILPPPLRLESGYEGFKSELLKSPAVQGVTASTGNPGSYPGIPFNFISDEAPESEPIRLDFMAVDFDYFTFFDIPVLEGRIFSPANSSDHGRTFILNETAVKKLGWDSAVGRTLREQRGEIEGRVIGVIQDYHNVSLHDHIQPAVYQVLSEMLGQVAVRPAAGKTDEALTFLKKKWAEWAPYNIFYFSYLDEDLTKLYEEERKAVLVFKIASALSVLIACLGLLGLAIHVVEQRTKEIGIRKTLGASVAEIIGLLCRDFLGPVLLANVIAWPIVYYLINRWLQDFVFHASLSVWVFILGGGIALVLPLVTVGFQVFKAAVADPVKTLRYE